MHNFSKKVENPGFIVNLHFHPFISGPHFISCCENYKTNHNKRFKERPITNSVCLFLYVSDRCYLQTSTKIKDTVHLQMRAFMSFHR